MRKFLFINNFIIVFLGAVSCTPKEVEPWWMTANIEAADNYMDKLRLEAGDSIRVKGDWSNGTWVYDSVCIIPSFENFYLGFSLQLSKSPCFYTESKAIQAYWNFMQTKRINVEKEKPIDVQKYIYAGIKDECSITADKKLFGIESGGNLGEHFKIRLYGNQKISVLYPSFDVVRNYYDDSTEVSFSNYFLKGTAMSFCPFFFYFSEAPEERYSEITFTIKIPIECVYLQQIINGEDYPESYYEQGLVERNENRVLHGSVTVRFEE